MNMKVLLPLTLSVLSGMACAANRDFNRDGKFLVENAETPYPSRKFRMPGGYASGMQAWTQVTTGLAERGYTIIGFLGRGDSKDVFECTKEGDSTRYVARISFNYSHFHHEHEIIRFLLPCSNCDLGRWLRGELKTRNMEDITESRDQKYKARLAKQGHSCNRCQYGRIRNPQLKQILLPTEAYFKTYVQHNDSAINSDYRNPLPILCEVQRWIRTLDRLFRSRHPNKEDVAMYKSLQARTEKAGLNHRDDAPRQAGVPSGESYAVYVDLDFAAPKRSPGDFGEQKMADETEPTEDSGRTKISQPKRAPSQSLDRLEKSVSNGETPLIVCEMCSGTGLPTGWEIAHSPDGTPYYWKTETEETQWDRPSGFCKACAVLIQNAEISTLNGWYRKRESTVRPPNARAGSLRQWRKWSGDRQWYQKDDGCYIVWYYINGNTGGYWQLHDADGKNRYVNRGRRGRGRGSQFNISPADKWKFWDEADAEAAGVYGRDMSKLVARTFCDIFFPEQK